LTGWRTPLKVTLLGPRRIWLNPNIFRSNKVTKATPPKPRRIIIKEITTHNNSFNMANALDLSSKMGVTPVIRILRRTILRRTILRNLKNM